MIITWYRVFTIFKIWTNSNTKCRIIQDFFSKQFPWLETCSSLVFVINHTSDSKFHYIQIIINFQSGLPLRFATIHTYWQNSDEIEIQLQSICYISIIWQAPQIIDIQANLRGFGATHVFIIGVKSWKRKSILKVMYQNTFRTRYQYNKT